MEQFLSDFSALAWGTPLLVLLLGGGLFLMVYSRFLPFRYFRHAVNVLRGKYDDPNDPGDLNHFKALSGALAATVGMGNISGVALAIATGGPGALFWMWMSAFVGMGTKFFTCTLAIMFRGKDSLGRVQGGPMYVIMEGLGRKWRPLAILFCLAGMFGPLPVFQANQLVQTVRDLVVVPEGLQLNNDFLAGVITAAADDPYFTTNLVIGLIITMVVGLVIFGGIKRIGEVASRLVPAMVVLYVAAVLYILAIHIAEVPYYLGLIVKDAFTAQAVLGGAVGEIIRAGARRAAFSNEAGIGTAPMMHGAAKTTEPVREGLVAMLGPAIDTLLVCTMTALAILVTGAWEIKDVDGVTMTAKAFEIAMPGIGGYVLLLCAVIFSITSLFSFSYYGSKCFGFLVGARYQGYFNYFYVATIVVGAVVSLSAVINLIDGMYALMAYPTMISALMLAPKVRKAAKEYFARL